MQKSLKRRGHHWGRCLSGFSAIISICQSSLATAGLTGQEAAQFAFQRGSFTEAAACCQQAAKTFRKQGNINAQVEALVNLAAAYQALGQHPKAVQTLSEAVGIANNGGDRSCVILAKSKLGAALAMTLQPERAEPLLRESLEMARGNTPLTAVVLNDLGGLLVTEQKHDEALAAFEESSTLARQSSDGLLTAQALCNAAATAAGAGMIQKAERLNGEAIKEIDRLEPSHHKAFLLATVAQTDQRIKPADSEDSNRLLLRAQQS